MTCKRTTYLLNDSDVNRFKEQQVHEQSFHEQPLARSCNHKRYLHK